MACITSDPENNSMAILPQSLTQEEHLSVDDDRNVHKVLIVLPLGGLHKNREARITDLSFPTTS